MNRQQRFNKYHPIRINLLRKIRRLFPMFKNSGLFYTIDRNGNGFWSKWSDKVVNLKKCRGLSWR